MENTETKPIPTIDQQVDSWTNGLTNLQAEASAAVGERCAIEHEAQALLDSIEPKLAALRLRMVPVDSRLQFLNMRIQDCHAKLAYLRGLRGGSVMAEMPQGVEMTGVMATQAEEQLGSGGVVMDPESREVAEEFARRVQAGEATPSTIPE